ncbi:MULTISPECIES: DUF6305 family protein [Pontibacillus]|uniref:DUF6305 family protein n=1 Tax=Pontibacillus chungwhensis TaxID=265426 RepID=A0ABY8UVF6_9BACI|nr:MULTISPECIES: DUF6305 family protein [Pontibacillus]MCD5324295.1 DUF6305 family protein [Pontibacillus sp. HN14]WIF97652.1 DUF6305 family protein [Pontibacillus chungwhensis]
MKKYSIVLALIVACGLLVLIRYQDSSEENWNTWPNLPAPVGKEPILITSAGQAIEGKVFSYIADELNLDGDYRPRALATDLYEYKTVVVVVGYSPHGVRQTYRSYEEEKERVEQLYDEAEARDTPIIVVQLSGASREDPYTWDLYQASIPHADYIIGIQDLEYNETLLEQAKQHSVPITLVEGIEDTKTPFNLAFR